MMVDLKRKFGLSVNTAVVIPSGHDGAWRVEVNAGWYYFTAPTPGRMAQLATFYGLNKPTALPHG